MAILIVDDSKPMRRLVERTVKQAGFTDHVFVHAENGEQALEIIREQDLILVLTDWNMPKCDGLELLKTAKAEKPDLPICFVTSEQTDERKSIATENGAIGLIGKPFKVEDFQQTLGSVL